MNAQTLPKVKMPNQANFIVVYPSQVKQWPCRQHRIPPSIAKITAAARRLTSDTHIETCRRVS
jgi:hypothetical protein